MSFPPYPPLIVNDEYRRRRKRYVKDSVSSYDFGSLYCPDCGGSIYYLRHTEYSAYLRPKGDEQPSHFWCYYCLRFFQRKDQLLDHTQLMARLKPHQ
jgi:hypothetical protein